MRENEGSGGQRREESAMKVGGRVKRRWEGGRKEGGRKKRREKREKRISDQ